MEHFQGATFANVATTAMKNINRRESTRIDIKLRCHVTSPAVWMRTQMHTENISRHGILVAWGDPGTAASAPSPLPAAGQILTVEIELPANHGFTPKCIHCQGTVTRVDFGEDRLPLVALEINYMDFRSFHDRLRSLETIQQPVANTWMA
jgi:hypothetical protein